MTIIGIDLSLSATGIVYLENGIIVGQKLIKTKPTSKDRTAELERLFTIRDSIDIEDVDLAVIEGLAFMARNTTALVQLAALSYMVTERLYKEKIKFCIVAPTSLKKFVCGKGNAAKELVMLETYKRYGISFSDNNLADAFVLSKIGEALLDESVKLTKPQQEVIKLLKTQITN